RRRLRVALAEVLGRLLRTAEGAGDGRCRAHEEQADDWPAREAALDVWRGHATPSMEIAGAPVGNRGGIHAAIAGSISRARAPANGRRQGISLRPRRAGGSFDATCPRSTPSPNGCWQPGR